MTPCIPQASRQITNILNHVTFLPSRTQPLKTGKKNAYPLLSTGTPNRNYTPFKRIYKNHHTARPTCNSSHVITLKFFNQHDEHLSHLQNIVIQVRLGLATDVLVNMVTKTCFSGSIPTEDFEPIHKFSQNPICTSCYRWSPQHHSLQWPIFSNHISATVFTKKQH